MLFMKVHVVCCPTVGVYSLETKSDLKVIKHVNEKLSSRLLFLSGFILWFKLKRETQNAFGLIDRQLKHPPTLSSSSLSLRVSVVFQLILSTDQMER